MGGDQVGGWVSRQIPGVRVRVRLGLGRVGSSVVCVAYVRDSMKTLLI